MSTYKIYELGSDGRVSGPPEVVSANDDGDALFAARKRNSLCDQEVWENTRLVAVVKPEARHVSRFS